MTTANLKDLMGYAGRAAGTAVGAASVAVKAAGYAGRDVQAAADKAHARQAQEAQHAADRAAASVAKASGGTYVPPVVPPSGRNPDPVRSASPHRVKVDGKRVRRSVNADKSKSPFGNVMGKKRGDVNGDGRRDWKDVFASLANFAEWMSRLFESVMRGGVLSIVALIMGAGLAAFNLRCWLIVGASSGGATLAIVPIAWAIVMWVETYHVWMHATKANRLVTLLLSGRQPGLLPEIDLRVTPDGEELTASHVDRFRKTMKLLGFLAIAATMAEVVIVGSGLEIMSNPNLLALFLFGLATVCGPLTIWIWGFFRDQILTTEEQLALKDALDDDIKVPMRRA